MRKLLHLLAFSYTPKLLASFLYSHAYDIPPSHSLSRSSSIPRPINQDSKSDLSSSDGRVGGERKALRLKAGVADGFEALCVCP